MFGFGSKKSPPQPTQRRSVPVVRAKYDSAQTTADNRRHWAAADGLAPNAAVNPSVRRTIRNRARYEIANNSYAKGIVLTVGNDTVGTGPRLQMLTEDPGVNRFIEAEFMQWAESVNLASKLRSMRVGRAESGESFGIFTTNPLIDSPVKLDLKLVEPDQVASPFSAVPKSNETDGIIFDSHGNPSKYLVLRSHPGDTAAQFGSRMGFDTYTADQVVHYFRADRPGQSRGIPDITPALPLFAQLRRFTLATIAAAETAADFAAVIYSDGLASTDDEPAEADAFDTVELEKRMATVLPSGWKLGQIQSQHPATTYQMFKGEILNEIARCLNMPFNIAAGNSSGYNYASGRLDHQGYFKSIRVEQDELRITVLNRIIRAWMNEAVLIEGFVPQSLRSTNLRIPHQWFWDGTEHVDPKKEAEAQEIRLASHTTTLAAEYAKVGRDWEEEIGQRAKEVSRLKELGLSEPKAKPDSSSKKDKDDADEESEESASASAA